MIIGVGPACNKTGVKKLGTHNGGFHTDEVLGTAVYALAHENAYIYVVRSRIPNVLKTLDIVIDVGGGEYDHHMAGYNERRHTGERYASAGLVWRRYGEKAIRSVMIQEGIYFDVEEVKRTKEQIDKEIFIPVDMEDNGDKISFHTFSFVPKFRPYWKKNPKDYDECFGRAVATAIDILREIIRDKVAEVDTKKELQNRIRSAEDGMMLLSDQEMPWKEGVCSYNREHNNEIKFVIFPYPAGGFAAQCVPPSMEKEFDQLVPFPEAWAGGNEETLPEISGIPDAIFCHNKRFFARAKSKESVIRMCEIAMGIQ